jgi:small subunit ribosomal protein S20
LKKNLSQLKRHRQNIKRRTRNRALRSMMRTSIRKAREAVAKDAASDEAKATVADATVTIDRMVTNGLVHKNTAARYKSRLMHHYNRGRPVPLEVEKEPPETPAEEI